MLLGAFTVGLAQQQVIKCSTMERDSVLRKQYPQMGTLEDFEQWLSPMVERYQSTAQPREVVTLPIVFHIIHDGEMVGEGLNLSTDLILAQLEQINNDFRKLDGTSGDNDDPVGADSEIEFCMAVVDPDGNVLAQPGINRVDRNDQGWSAPPYSPGFIDGTIKPNTIWDPERYINCWVMTLSSSPGSILLGYAQFPSASGLPGMPQNGGPANTDGVVVNTLSVGSTELENPESGGSSFGYGRTLTHELGHFFGLRHIWGDGGCGVDDFVDDTPLSDAPHSGCPTGDVSCGTEDMVENYMDYSADLCMNIYTLGQKARMQVVLEQSPRRRELLNSTACSSEPVEPIADFSANRTTIEATESVSFTDQSLFAPDSWSWSFPGGNPSSSNQQNPTVTYDTPGTYDVTLSVSNEAGNDTETKTGYITVTPNIPGCDDGLANFPIAESFESDLGPWSNASGDDFDWTRTSGGTPSGATGPSGAADGNFYLYTEASVPNSPNKTAILDLECVNLGGLDGASAGFQYHLFGGSIGTLDLQISTDEGNTYTTIWSRSGDQGNQWRSAEVDLTPYLNFGVRMRFVATTGNSFDGDMAIDDFRITDQAVGNPPVADFSADQTSVETGATVNFTDLSSENPSSWEWTFQGGTPASSTEQNPAVTYNTAGVYTVTLTASNAFGSDSETKTGYITVSEPGTPPTAEFSASATTVDEGQSVSFTDLSTGGPTSWSWSFPGGSPSSSSAQNPTVTYNTAGVYNVSLTVTNANGSDSETKTGYITVNAVAPGCPVVVSSFPYSESFESGLGQWTQNDDDDIDWTRTSFSTPSRGTGPSAAADGQFYLFTESTGASNSSAILTAPCFDLSAAGSASFDFQYHLFGFSVGSLAVEISEDGGLNYTQLWSQSGSQGDQWRSASIDLSAYTGQVIKLRFAATTGSSFSSDMAIDDIQLNASGGSGDGPTADFSGSPRSISTGQSVSFTDQSSGGPTSWSWSFPGGTPSSSSAQNPTVIYNTAGAYNVSLTVSNADGSDSETKFGYITVSEPGSAPVADFTASATTIQAGQSVSFTDLSSGSPTSWSWSFGGGTPSASSAQNPTVTYNTAGTYDVSLTASNAFGSDSEIKVGYIVVQPGGGGSGCSGGVSSYPYAESFEADLGLWRQSTGDDIDWTRTSGSTPTPRTGPFSAGEGEFYLFVESSGNDNATAALMSPCFDLNAAASASIFFQYNLYGTNVGTLRLEASDDDGASWSELWSEDGNQGTRWLSETVSLNAYTGTGLRLRFRATTATGGSSDIAIDDIRITTGGTRSTQVGNRDEESDRTVALNLKLFPNPTSSTLNLAYQSDRNEEVTLTVVNTLGQIVKQQQWSVVEGYNQQPLQLDQLGDGAYWIVIRNSEDRTSKRFIIQR